MSKLKRGIDKTKKFLRWSWESDSWLSYIVFILLIFILIKLIIFPFLNLVTGTSLPLAIVESCSMYHKGNIIGSFDNWWDYSSSKYLPYEISKEQFENFILKKGFNKGDILFVVGAKPEKLKIGDIIIFQTGNGNPIIHRIIKITKQEETYTFSTQGDHNNGQLPSEISISEEQILGKATSLKIPYIGWIKLIFFEPFRNPSSRGFCQANF